MDIPQLHLFSANYQQPLAVVTSQTPMLEVIHLMNQTHTSCVLIVEQENLLGILTKTDVVRALANQAAFAKMMIAELMSQPVITLSETDLRNIPIVLQRFQQYQISHLPVINDQGQVLGIVTPLTIQNALTPCDLLQLLQTAQLLAQREAQYRTSEARLKDILNSAIAASIVSFRVFSDGDWEYEYQSPGCELLFGYTSEEMMADKNLWMSRIHPQDLTSVILPLFSNFFMGITSSVEFRFHHKNGSLHWISATYASRYDEEKKCWVVTGIEIDISQRKQVEAALKASEERWQLAIAGTDEAIWDWDITTNLTFRSDRWFEMLGYQRHELSNWDDEWKNRLHPEDAERVMAAQSAYLQGQTDSYRVEYRLLCQDGSYRWFRSRAKAVWDEAGNPIRLVGSMGDISDRKATELALQEREAMLRRIGDNLPNGAIYQFLREVNGGDRFTYLSAGMEKLVEASAADALQDFRLLYNQLIEPDQLRIEAAINESMRQLSIFDLHVCIRTPSDRIKWLHFRSTPRRWSDTCVVWDGLIVDITDIKNYEETLRHNQALLEESQRVARLGSWECNQETGKILWSNQLCHLFNQDPNQVNLNYQAIQQLFYPEDAEKLNQAIAHAIATGESYKLLLRVHKADDSIMYIKAIGHAQMNQHGQVSRLYGTAQDVTDNILAEEKLRQSEARLAATQQIAHVGSWEFDIKTQTCTWSQETFKIFGFSHDHPEPSYAEVAELFYPGDLERFETNLRQAIAQSQPVTCEYRIIRHDGSLRYIESRGEVVKDRQGQVFKLLGAIIDITERKHIEQTLQEKEAFLRSIYNGLGQPIFVVDFQDNDFIYVGLNPAHEKMTGLRSQDLQGKTPEQVVPPEIAKVVRQRYQNCVDAGETITYEECLPFQGELTWWITSLTPLFDQHSRIYRIVGTGINISDRKRTERMLELQAVITSNIAEGVCLIRADDGVIVYANPKFEQMFGYESGDLIGQHVSIVNYADEQKTPEEVYQEIAAIAIQEGEVIYEVHNVKKDGTSFWCSGTASVFEHPEHGAVFVAVQQDITQQKQVEAKIRASLKEKEVLLKEIHHRVKNNLGIVSSLLQMQCRRTQDPQATAILQDSQNRIAAIALVHEKLYRSHNLSNINFSQYIADLTTHLFDSYHVSSNDIQLKIQVDNVHLDVETAIPCGLIINELVSNALKYAFPVQPTGEIQVSVYQEPDQKLILTVRDDGIGLPEDFELKQTKTLGMTLIQGLVKQLRGDLEINNDQGTEFKISLTSGKL